MARESRRGAGTHRYTGRRRALPVWWHRRITWGKAVWRRLSPRPGIAHLVRAMQRFADRMGNQFAAAITYFSFLSLVPILMVSFSAAGFVLASRPDLLDGLKEQVVLLLGASFDDIIDKAVEQRYYVGAIGLLIALYSGLTWIGNVRDAVQAMWRPHWVRAKVAQQTFWADRLSDLISLAGLLVAMVITFSLTAVGTAAKELVVRLLGVGDIDWITTALDIGPFVVAICADVLIFAWSYTIMPFKGYRASRRTLLIGSVTMAVVFEVLKSALTLVVSRLSSSPTGAVFGVVIGLLIFFNLVARAFLMVAAWMGTAAEQPGDDEPGPAPEVTVVLRESPPRVRVPTALGAGAVLGWIYGRNRRR